VVAVTPLTSPIGDEKRGYDSVMRRSRPAACCIVLAASTLAATSFASPAPRVDATQLAPFTVSGTNFHPGEMVRVTVMVAGERPAVRRRAAGTKGRFVLQFAGVVADPCSLYFIAAKGDKGSRATARAIPRACGALP
jgi:hypothetical protein